MTDNPLLKKLRIKPDQMIAVLHPPAGYMNALGKLPNGVLVDSELVGRYDLIHVFFTHFQEIEIQIEAIKTELVDRGILWIFYPKQSAKQNTDLNRDILREPLLNPDLKAVAQISIDDTWSALRFKTL
jgi:hypothetical protein